jgi:hypothetical protein
LKKVQKIKIFISIVFEWADIYMILLSILRLSAKKFFEHLISFLFPLLRSLYILSVLRYRVFFNFAPFYSISDFGCINLIGYIEERESTAGYTFTPCVGSFACPGIDTQVQGISVLRLILILCSNCESSQISEKCFNPFEKENRCIFWCVNLSSCIASNDNKKRQKI